jgi:hypothetical protein
MAVVSVPVNTAMSIRYMAGIDLQGNDIIKAKRFSNIKVTAASEDMLSIATTLGASAMDSIISKNIFASAGGDLVAKHSA